MPSEKVLEAKKAKVEQLTETLKNAVSFVIVDYKGITVEEDTKLRRDLRAENVKYSVEKNSLLRFALKNAGIEGLDDVLEGTTAIAVSNEDQTAPARVLGKYASEMDGKFNLKPVWLTVKFMMKRALLLFQKFQQKTFFLHSLLVRYRVLFRDWLLFSRLLQTASQKTLLNFYADSFICLN